MANLPINKQSILKSAKTRNISDFLAFFTNAIGVLKFHFIVKIIISRLKSIKNHILDLAIMCFSDFGINLKLLSPPPHVAISGAWNKHKLLQAAINKLLRVVYACLKQAEVASGMLFFSSCFPDKQVNKIQHMQVSKLTFLATSSSGKCY